MPAAAAGSSSSASAGAAATSNGAKATSSTKLETASNSRTLRIQCGDKLFDWFDVDEEQEIISAPDVLKILKENVAHYFKVPVENQVLFDEEGVIATKTDLRRSFKMSGKPRVVVGEKGKLTADQGKLWSEFLTDMERLIVPPPAPMSGSFATAAVSGGSSTTGAQGAAQTTGTAGGASTGAAAGTNIKELTELITKQLAPFGRSSSHRSSPFGGGPGSFQVDMSGRARSLTPQVRGSAGFMTGQYSRGVSPQPGSLSNAYSLIQPGVAGLVSPMITSNSLRNGLAGSMNNPSNPGSAVKQLSGSAAGGGPSTGTTTTGAGAFPGLVSGNGVSTATAQHQTVPQLSNGTAVMGATSVVQPGAGATTVPAGTTTSSTTSGAAAAASTHSRVLTTSSLTAPQPTSHHQQLASPQVGRTSNVTQPGSGGLQAQFQVQQQSGTTSSNTTPAVGTNGVAPGAPVVTNTKFVTNSYNLQLQMQQHQMAQQQQQHNTTTGVHVQRTQSGGQQQQNLQTQYQPHQTMIPTAAPQPGGPTATSTFSSGIRRAATTGSTTPVQLFGNTNNSSGQQQHPVVATTTTTTNMGAGAPAPMNPTAASCAAQQLAYQFRSSMGSNAAGMNGASAFGGGGPVASMNSPFVFYPQIGSTPSAGGSAAAPVGTSTGGNNSGSGTSIGAQHMTIPQTSFSIHSLSNSTATNAGGSAVVTGAAGAGAAAPMIPKTSFSTGSNSALASLLNPSGTSNFGGSSTAMGSCNTKNASAAYNIQPVVSGSTSGTSTSSQILLSNQMSAAGAGGAAVGEHQVIVEQPGSAAASASAEKAEEKVQEEQPMIAVRVRNVSDQDEVMQQETPNLVEEVENQDQRAQQQAGEQEQAGQNHLGERTADVSSEAVQQLEQDEAEQPVDVFENRKRILLQLEKGDVADRFGFSSVPYAHGGLEITRVDRGGLLAQWNTVRRQGGPSAMVGVGDVIFTVNSVGPDDDEKMRNELETRMISLLVVKMRT
ncbi:unnamed protein product [Amoebophrya sp. A120]|nr:unnamed protein product [Amoebophrya sp. A120]|eukprot:GSA120T00009809001.1